MTKFEEFVIGTFLRENLQYKDGKYFVEDDKIKELNLNTKEHTQLLKILNLSAIEISYNRSSKNEEKTTRYERSKLVRDFEYGSAVINGGHKSDIPSISKIEITNEDQIVFEVYTKLEKLIDERIIPTAKVIKQGIIKNFKSVQLNSLIKLKLSELELAYAFNYLANRGIFVSGVNGSIAGEFENYNYINTYKSLKDESKKGLTKEQNKKLFKEYTATKDQSIRDRIIEGNCPLVKFILWPLAYKNNMPLEELASYGYEGLINAVDRFDYTKGYTFSTYASHCIYNKALNGIIIERNNNNSNSTLFWDIMDAKSLIEENQDTLHLDIVAIIETVRGPFRFTKRKEEVLNLVSLDFPISIDTIEDKLIDDDFEESIISKTLSTSIHDVLLTLTPRKVKILDLRFGLTDGQTKTQEEVGQQFNLSGERIRQIEAKALRKLRHPSRSKTLKDFFIDY